MMEWTREGDAFRLLQIMGESVRTFADEVQQVLYLTNYVRNEIYGHAWCLAIHEKFKLNKLYLVRCKYGKRKGHSDSAICRWTEQGWVGWCNIPVPKVGKNDQMEVFL